MKNISVLGMGPGHKDYIIPKVWQEIEAAQIIVGGKRILESLPAHRKETISIGADLEGLVGKMKEKSKEKKVAILVSGDTGFYSMLGFLKKHFTLEELNIVPGISSMQYFFAKIGETWDDAHLTSVHGRDLDLVEVVKKYPKVGLLTDKNHSPQDIAKTLLQGGINNKKIYVGQNLSYDNEHIFSGNLEDIAKEEGYKMCVVVIADE